MMRAILLVLMMLASPVAAQTVQEAQAQFIAGDHAGALRVIEPAARGGDALAQALLAAAFETGLGRDLDARLAVQWYGRAAEHGFAPAHHALALIYFGGREGVPADAEAATRHLDQAMALGHAPAFLMRAQMLLTGQGAEANPAAGAALALTALELGAPDAGMLLADLYLTGQGVPQDEGRARAAYARAAQMGHAPALARLAVMHELGQGGPVDLMAAYTLYQEAVNLGDASAAVNLAAFMAEHEGYWSNPVLAYAYCLWGAENAPETDGQDYAAPCRALAETLSEGQRKEGEELAASF